MDCLRSSHTRQPPSLSTWHYEQNVNAEVQVGLGCKQGISREEGVEFAVLVVNCQLRVEICGCVGAHLDQQRQTLQLVNKIIR